MTIMRLRTFRVIGLFLVTLSMLAGTLAIYPHEAAAQACSKVNQVKVTKGTKFVCTKVGNRLQWQQQRATAVASATTRPPTATPKPVPVKAVEWSTCTKAAATSGSISTGLVCIRYQGNLTWVSRKTLNDPWPFEPCLGPGSTAYANGEKLTCVRDPDGNLWYSEAFLEEAARTANARDYIVENRTCHGNTTTVLIEKLDLGSWVSAGSTRAFSNANCPAGTSRFVAEIRSSPGVQIRFRVFTSRWVWYSKPAILGSISQVAISGDDGLDWTFSSASVTSTTTVGAGAAAVSQVSIGGYRLLSYRAIGLQNHLLFSVPLNERSFVWGGVTRANVGGVDVSVAGQPAAGSVIAPGGTFLVVLNRGNYNETPATIEIQHSATRGQIASSQGLLVNFTWR